MLNIVSEYLIMYFLPKFSIVALVPISRPGLYVFYIIKDILAQAHAPGIKVVLQAQIRLLPWVSIPLHVDLPIAW